jgi:hypothetical protein
LKYILPITIFCLFFFETAVAQSELDTLEFIKLIPPINNLSTKLDKQLNTYYLNSHLLFYKSVDNVTLKLAENYNSTFIRSTQKSIRDEQLLGLMGDYQVSPVYKIGAAVNSNILSDSRKIEINQASTSDVSVFTEFRPADELFIAPYYGYEINRQIGEKDFGAVYGGEGALPAFKLADLSFSSEAKFRNEDISPRKNALRYLKLNIANNFYPDVSNNLMANYYQNRKDFYFPADSITNAQFDVVNNIQSRIETGYAMADQLQNNNFLNLFALNLRGAVNWRSIDRDTRYRSTEVNSPSIFDTKINELKFELESVASYKSDSFNGAFRVLYSERNEQHITKNFDSINPIFFEQRSDLESQKNNNSTRISASLLGGVNFSKTDNLIFSLFQNKLRYDTPSQENFDDRDELLSIIRIRYSKILNPFFEAFANIEGTQSHTVYLFSEKSSNNNINRVLSLKTGGIYSGKIFTSLNSFEVSANYTVYDFENISPNFKSFSFRQYTASDSTVLRIGQKMALAHKGYVKLSEQGDLNWQKFSSKPTRFLQEIYSEPKIIVYYLGAQFALGLRLFELYTYNYKEEVKVIESKYFSIGPLSDISMIVADRLLLKILGWYEFITINDIKQTQQANLTMELSWNF